MGIVKSVKLQTAGTTAARAAAAGRAVLVYRQNVPASKGGWSGEIPDMGEVIEEIERYGWLLASMSFDGHQSSHGGCILMFRRAPAR